MTTSSRTFVIAAALAIAAIGCRSAMAQSPAKCTSGNACGFIKVTATDLINNAPRKVKVEGKFAVYAGNGMVVTTIPKFRILEPKESWSPSDGKLGGSFTANYL